MIVWGGIATSSGVPLPDGGRYILLEQPDADADGIPFCAGDCDDDDPVIYPGAPQIRDGKNDHCLAAGWPSVSGTGEADDDGDGLNECADDCDDTDGGVWSAPGEVIDLLFDADGSSLSRCPPADPGGLALRGDALRSPAAGDFVGPAACVESDDGADTAASDFASPSPGGVLDHVIRAEDSCPAGQGSLGSASLGVPRAGRACP